MQIRTFIHAVLALALLATPLAPIAAQEEAAAAAEVAAPAPDAVIDELIKLDPAQLAERVKAMKAEVAELDKQAEEVRKQAAELDGQIQAMQQKLEPFLATLKAVAEANGMAPKPEPAPADAAMAPAGAEMGGEMAPGMQQAVSEAPPNFADHVLPIFEANCASCHNDDKQRGGLSLANFDAAMYGAASGEVITPGQPDNSRLLKLIMQIEEPKMPPSGAPLGEADVATIRAWIAGGALASAGAKSMVAEAETSADAPVFVAAEMADTPPMPEAELAGLNDPLPRGIVARAIASSPTAPLMAVAGNEQVLLYALDEPRLLGALPFPEGDVFTLTFSVNGEILVAGGGEEGDSGITVLWNIRTGERLGEFGKAYDTVLAADISPDHTMLAVGGPNRVVRVYSTQTGDELYSLDSHTDWIYALRFSPDGELLASADRAGNLALWQAANGRAVESLRGHEGPIHDLSYTVDSTVLASAGGDGKVFLWDTWNYTQIRNFGAHGGAVFAVDFASNGQLVTSGKDGVAKRWDQAGTELKVYPNLGDWAYQACFAQDGAIVAAGDWSGEVILWQAESAEPAATFTTNPDPSVQVATAPAASAQ